MKITRSVKNRRKRKKDADYVDYLRKSSRILVLPFAPRCFISTRRWYKSSSLIISPKECLSALEVQVAEKTALTC